MPVLQVPDSRIRSLVEDIDWYHTLDLGHGLVTHGLFDHRPHLHRYGFPDRLDGRTVLDAGTSDGFFAFEAERRGAARVVGIDTDRFDGRVGHSDISPARYGTYEAKYARNTAVNAAYQDVAAALGLPVVDRRRIAAAVRGSRVEFRIQSVYDLASAGEKFDLVFCGDLIEHLKHPLAAVEQLRAATADAGLCVICIANGIRAGSRAPRARRVLRKAIDVLRLGAWLQEASRVAVYKGNGAGGAFFHFHPLAFAEALVASGFADVRLHSEFDLTHRRTRESIHHVVFHCRS